jgi:hypothetical protein
VSLQKSPFFSDMYMTVGDWNFRLWKVDNETPIFTSPNASTYITVVRTRRHMLHFMSNVIAVVYVCSC